MSDVLEVVRGGVELSPPVKKQLTATFPGKLGDALLQFPVMYWHWQDTGERFACWMDEKSLRPLANLFASQPCVEEVLFKPGIENYNMGGQPFEFNLTVADHLDRQFVHLGFRQFPTKQITLETLANVPLKIQRRDTISCLTVAHNLSPKRRLVLHGKFTSHASGVPSFWKFLADHAKELENLYEEIVFVGTAGERKRALELYPDWSAYDDGGDFLHLAMFVAPAEAVIACGSSVAALGGVLGVPTLRIHDPIGDAAAIIWSNLGPNQFNLTEEALRTQWPEVRASLSKVAV